MPKLEIPPQGGVVGERSYCSEAHGVNRGGAVGSENVGMSSEIMVKIQNAENPRFPSQRSSGTGQSELRQAPILSGVARCISRLKFGYNVRSLMRG